MTSYNDFKKLLRERRFKEAAHYAEAATVNSTDVVFWLNQQAVALMRMGCSSEAIEVTEQALARNPANEYSVLIRSEALLQQGEAAGALDGFREALQYQRTELRARKGMLDCLLRLHRYEEVFSQLDSAEENFPWRIKALLGLGRAEEAVAVCREWLSVSPDNRQALWLLCDLELKLDGITATLAKYERMAKILSRPPIYGELCAMLYRKSGKVDRALGQYEQIAKRSNDPAIVRRKAFALAKSGRENEALPLFEELLRADPNNHYVHSAYGAAARRAGYLEQAWKFYHELLSLYPEQKTLFGKIKKLGKEIERITPSASEISTEY